MCIRDSLYIYYEILDNFVHIIIVKRSDVMSLDDKTIMDLASQLGISADKKSTMAKAKSFEKKSDAELVSEIMKLKEKLNPVSYTHLAKGRPVMEFGTRRAHGTAAAVFGARAAYIGGCAGTACAIADRDYGITALGTMAHSWVQMFPSEYEAFKKYAEIYPDNCVLLVDTYNVLRSGVPAAIKVFKELKPKKMGIRIDSGDVAYLTKKARKMLDEAGLTE